MPMILLPLSEAAAEADESGVYGEAGGDAGEMKNVLLVEDEAMVRQVCQAMLERLGMSVHVASNGKEALDLFKKRRDEMEAVICDLAMPDMDGWETISVLRDIRPEVPVVMISGFEEAEVFSGEHQHLPDAFLRKPFELQELKAALEKIRGKTDFDN